MCPVDALDTATQPVEITFWYPFNQEVHVQTLEALIATYNESQSRVRVNAENQQSYEDNITKFNQSSVESRPNLVLLPEYVFQQMSDSNTAIPVGACIQASGYDDSVINPRPLTAYQSEGVQWAMAFNVSNPVLYYNRLVFEAAGLDPDDPPTTFDEVREYSRQIVDSGAAPYGLALESGADSGGGWFLEQWLAKAGEFYSDNDNGRAERSTMVLFDGPTGVDLLTQVQNLINDGLAVYVGENANGIDQFLRMADQSSPSAMAIGTSAGVGPITAILGGGLIPGVTADDIGVGPMPGPGPGVAVGGAAMYITAGKDPAQVAATWDFMQFLMSAQSQSTWAAATGYVPIRADALDLEPLTSTYATDPRFRVAYDQITSEGAASTAQFPAVGPLREIRGLVARAVGAIMTGADVQTSLTEAATQANSLITQYNELN